MQQSVMGRDSTEMQIRTKAEQSNFFVFSEIHYQNLIIWLHPTTHSTDSITEQLLYANNYVLQKTFSLLLVLFFLLLNDVL